MIGRALPEMVAAGAEAAPPRSNGELVFAAPWESRAFGVAIALHDAGAIDYEVFRSRLIAQLARDPEARVESGADYYERWLDALEQVLDEHGIVSAGELDDRAAEIAHAWDHDHDHVHTHPHAEAHP